MPTRQATAVRKRLTRDEKNAQTRARLLEAAREVFGRRGYGAASLEEIADEAGFSRGALYHHFEGKEELFLALLDERLTERVREIEAAFDDEAPTEEAALEQARRAARDTVDAFRQNREWRALHLEFVAAADRDPRFREALALRWAACRDALTRVVERRARELGLELPLPAQQLALAIEALGSGLAMQEIVEPEVVPDELFGTVLGFLLRGVAESAR